MLTKNADTHLLLRTYHRLKDEKRMLVLLPGALWAKWLEAPFESSLASVSQYPAERMIAMDHPVKPEAKPASKRAAPKPAPGQGDCCDWRISRSLRPALSGRAP